MKTTSHQWSQELTLDTALADTPEIQVSEAKEGTVYVPSGSPITTLTFHAAPQIGRTYVALYAAAGTAVTQTVAAARAYPLPAECFGSGAIKITTNADGAVEISLKS